MSLKERVRDWLGVAAVPAPAPAPAPTAPPFGLGGMSGQRQRVTLDNPSLAYLQGLTYLAPFDAERRWRGMALDEQTLSRLTTAQIMDLMADLSPEISKAHSDLLRLANPGWEAKAYRVGGTEDVIDPRAQAALDDFLHRQLKGLYGDVNLLINRLYTGAFYRGAFLAELVLDNRGRVPLDLACPDPQWIYFRIRQDPERGPVWEPYQFQRGDAVSLERPTICYLPLDPLPGNPYGRAIAQPALFTTIFTLSLLHDLRRVVAQQGYPRIDVEINTEELVKVMPAGINTDPETLRNWLASVVADVRREYDQLEPDDAYIHPSFVKINRPVGAISADALSGVKPLTDMLERQVVRGLRTIPLLQALAEQGSETHANRAWEIMAATIRSLQHGCESLLEKLLTLSLQVQGIQARVEFRFEELRQAELLRDAQVETLQTENAGLKYQLGYLSQDEACLLATGKAKADQQEPRMAAPPVSLTGSQPVEPGAVQAEPGSNRGLVTNGSGRGW